MIRDGSFDDLLYIANRLRDRDLQEIMATRTKFDPVELAADAADAPGFYRIAEDKDDRPAMVLGVRYMHEGVVTVWGFGTPHYRDCVAEMTDYARRYIIPSVLMSGVHRAQCLVHSENRASQRWLKALGFQPEATLSRFGAAGEDFILYARTADARPEISPESFAREDHASGRDIPPGHA